MTPAEEWQSSVGQLGLVSCTVGNNGSL